MKRESRMEIIMKVRIPKHREFVINMADCEEHLRDECWEKLNAIVKDYGKTGGSLFSETFIEDNEEKVKALQEQYHFTYTVEWR